MKKYLPPLFMSLICTLCFVATFMAFGWFLFFFGILFIGSLILQLFIIWTLYDSKGRSRVFLIVSIFIFSALCLFREDGGDTSKSLINGLSVITYMLGLRENARYEGATLIGQIINFVWIVLLGFQIFILIKFKKKRKLNKMQP